MTKLFLKALSRNVLYVLVIWGMIYSFMAVSSKYLGNELYGLITFIGLLLAYWITNASWHQAKREVGNE